VDAYYQLYTTPHTLFQNRIAHQGWIMLSTERGIPTLKLVTSSVQVLKLSALKLSYWVIIMLHWNISIPYGCGLIRGKIYAQRAIDGMYRAGRCVFLKLEGSNACIQDTSHCYFLISFTRRWTVYRCLLKSGQLASQLSSGQTSLKWHHDCRPLQIWSFCQTISSVRVSLRKCRLPMSSWVLQFYNLAFAEKF